MLTRGSPLGARDAEGLSAYERERNKNVQQNRQVPSPKACRRAHPTSAHSSSTRVARSTLHLAPQHLASLGIEHAMCGKKAKRPELQAKAEKKAKRPAGKPGRLGEFSLFLPKGGAKARPQAQAEKEIVCLTCGSGDDEEGNEILICAHEKSGRCCGAHHQHCLSPPVEQARALEPNPNPNPTPNPTPNPNPNLQPSS